jgi:translation initiation factor 4G
MGRPSYMGPSPSGSGPSLSGVPSRPMSQGPPIFIPGQHSQQGSLQPAALPFQPSVVPRQKAALVIKRPDGTAVDVAAAAPTKSNGNTPEPVAPAAVAAPVAPKKTGPVKMESEEQRKARLAEEAQKEKSKKDEESSEQEQKDKKEREAKEAEEKRVAEEAKAKEEAVSVLPARGNLTNDQAAKQAKEAAAEEQKKKDEAAAAEEAATKKRSEEEAAAKAAKDESDKAAQAKAASTAESSATDSASASPNPAGLPAKPTLTARRPVPAALDLKPSTPKPATPSPTAMLTAKPITDLSSINYQAPIQSPSAALNKDSLPGKFRYDRDFLMQFMAICMEKPDRLPPLEEIGLESDTGSSGFGKRGGRPSSGTGYPRNASGPGGSGSGGPRQSSGMGQFGTGSNFGTGHISGTRGTTSQIRYEQSLANNKGGGHGATRGGRTGARPPSDRGQPRQPRNANPHTPYSNPYEPAPAPLVVSENSWVNSRPGKEPEDTRSPTYVARKVKGLLNKLTEEKFDSISGKILDYANYSVDENNGQSLKLVIKLIFEKATDEAHWSAMYAKLCRKMLDEVDPRVTEHIDGKDVAGGVLFRKYLIGRCQQDFESGWKERETAALKAQQKQEDDKQTLANHAAGGESAEPAVLSDEYYAAQKAKRRGLGLVQLIGELFKMDMVNKNVMKQCFLKLLGNVDETDEEDIESACKLLTTIGAVYDSQSAENVEGIMNRLAIIKDKKDNGVSSRVKFMIMVSVLTSLHKTKC